MYDVNQNVVSNSNVNNTITFTGRVYDSESNLYYYRNRMYSPELARFISKDPKGYVDGMNLYAYVKNNPLKYLDPMGTRAIASRSDDYDVVEQTIKFTNAQGQPSTLTYSTNSSDYNIETKTKNTVTTIGQIGKMSYSTIVNPSMTKATYSNSSYTKFSTGIEIIEGNGKVSPYNPSLAKSSVNKFSGYKSQEIGVYGNNSEYDRTKQTSDALMKISEWGGYMVVLHPAFGYFSTISGTLSYSIEPDKSLENDFSQISGNALDLLQEVKRK
jgi:RHS repeat-associated protein